MKEKKTGELIASSLASIVTLVIVNAVPLWRPFTHGVVLASFTAILWAFNLSCLAQLMGNVSLMFYRPPRFSAVVRLLTTLTGLLSTIVFFTVFPLDFGAIDLAWINSVLRIVLIVGMCGAGLAGIVQIVQMCAGWNRLEYDAR